MTAAIIKLLGTAHGLFALWTLLVLPSILKGGAFSQLSSVQTSIKLTATFIGIAMLFLCMWFSWQLSANSIVFAWSALGTFVLSAFSDTVALRGPAGMFRLMPAFYKAIFIRAIAASMLTVAVLGLHDGAASG